MVTSTRTRRVSAVAAATLALGALAGCSTSTTTTTATTPAPGAPTVVKETPAPEETTVVVEQTPAAPQETTVVAQPPATPDPNRTAAAAARTKFGAVYTSPSGVEMSVSAPTTSETGRSVVLHVDNGHPRDDFDFTKVEAVMVVDGEEYGMVDAGQLRGSVPPGDSGQVTLTFDTVDQGPTQVRIHNSDADAVTFGD